MLLQAVVRVCVAPTTPPPSPYILIIFLRAFLNLNLFGSPISFHLYISLPNLYHPNFAASLEVPPGRTAPLATPPSTSWLYI